MSSSDKSQSASKSHDKQPNALDLLKADHKKVNEMFSEYEQTSAANKKKQLAADICIALTTHSQVEEEMFYPDVKKALKDKELVPEATVEHQSIKNLVAQLAGDDQGGEMFDAKVRVLSEYVKHHVKEEESEMFPKIKQSSIDLVELGTRMAARFDDLRAAPH